MLPVAMLTRYMQEVADTAAKELGDAETKRLRSKAQSLLSYLVRNYFSFQNEGSGADEFFATVTLCA